MSFLVLFMFHLAKLYLDAFDGFSIQFPNFSMGFGSFLRYFADAILAILRVSIYYRRGR